MNGIDGERDLKSYTKRLYWCVLFYMTANALVLPITPYFATSLNATNTQYSLVFTIYYIAMLLASFIFGKIGDTYGRRIALLVSLFGLTTFTICQIYSKDANMFIVFRFLTGLFDAQTSMFQACMGDVTLSHQRAHYLSQLEAINNIAQAIGPFIGGILSSYSLSASMWYACGCYCVSFILILFILPESVSIVLEKQRIVENLKSQNLTRAAFDEQKKRLFYQLSLHQEATSSSKHLKKKKLKLNYIMVIAIIGEFCCRWLISVFDISIAQFAEEHHGMTSFDFSMASCLGSVINTLQTGWLFNKFLSWNLSIPIITSFAGLAGAAGLLMCVFSQSKSADFIASLFLIIAYGFAAPTAPTIMSTESSADTQGVAVALVLIGGQSAYMTAPSVLSAAYSQSYTLPFLISLVPCGLVTISMVILHFIPGGRTAGQIPLDFALESYLKDQKMEALENEEEMDVLAAGGVVPREKEYKKEAENDIMIEMTTLESKKKMEDNEDIHLQEEMVDMGAFVVRPRLDGFTRTNSYTRGSEDEKSDEEKSEKDVSSSEDDMAI